MASKKEAITKALNGIIERLEEARSSALEIGDSDGLHIEIDDMDSDIQDHIEGGDSALIILESRINYLVDVMGEEIENLIGLLETLKENE